jgi:hypothetical protein
MQVSASMIPDMTPTAAMLPPPVTCHAVDHHAAVRVAGCVDPGGVHGILAANLLDELVGEVDIVVVDILASAVPWVPLRSPFAADNALGVCHDEVTGICLGREPGVLGEPLRTLPVPVETEDQGQGHPLFIGRGCVQDVLPGQVAVRDGLVASGRYRKPLRTGGLPAGHRSGHRLEPPAFKLRYRTRRTPSSTGRL